MSLTFDGIAHAQGVEGSSLCRYSIGLVGVDVEGMKGYLMRECMGKGLRVLSTVVSGTRDGRVQVLMEVESGRGIV